jgi:hypothetical protein
MYKLRELVHQLDLVFLARGAATISLNALSFKGDRSKANSQELSKTECFF